MLDELEQGYGFDHLLPASTGLSHLFLGLIWKCSRALGDRRYDSTLRVRQVAEYLRQVPEGTVAIGALTRMANLSGAISAPSSRGDGLRPHRLLSARESTARLRPARHHRPAREAHRRSGGFLRPSVFSPGYFVDFRHFAENLPFPCKGIETPNSSGCRALDTRGPDVD